MTGKFIRAVLLLDLLLLASPAIGFGESPERATLRVGISAALSGPVAEFGSAAVHGFIMASEENPEAFRALEWIVSDDRYDPKAAVNNFHSFRARGAALVFTAGVAPSEAVEPLARAFAVPLLMNCQDARVGRENPLAVRVVNVSAQYSLAMLKHLRQRGYKRFAILAASSTYTDALLDVFSKALEPGETIVTLLRYDTSTTDFRTAVTQLKAESVDALGVYLFPGQFGSFFRKAREQRLHLPVFGSDTFESMTEVTTAQGGLSGAVFASNKVDPEFRRRYVARFGTDAQITTAANSYDVAQLLARASQACRSSDGVCILEQLRQTADYTGVTGTLHYRDHPQFGGFLEAEVVIKTVD
ncbi:MAG: ABC transporter substrate-binding protein [Bdellovibrionales bacterium]|nr:ABC transporter substrate-binding protein [Bdellovibrionales bacterium]